MTDSALRLQNLTKKFGGVTAVDDVSPFFGPGAASAIIGPNGRARARS